VKYPSYTYPIDKLTTGSSLGNYHLFARFDAETNLKGLWSADDNQFYVGEWECSFDVDGIPAQGRFTEFFPESQSTTYSHEGVTVTKLAFLPFFLEQEANRHVDEMHSLVYLIRLLNESEARRHVRFRQMIYFPADRSPLFTKQPPLEQMDKQVKITSSASSCEIITENAEAEARVLVSGMPWKLCEGNDRSLMIEFEIDLEQGERKEVPFVLSISDKGIDQAHRNAGKSDSPGLLLEKSRGSYTSLLRRSMVLTPDDVINRGVAWAKVNTVRVQHRYPIGEAFTNDPPQDIVVVRDVAWYVFGSDYLTPEFSRNMLDVVNSFGVHEGGKLTEYIHANEIRPEKHDYKLNINDDTPLLVAALFHHGMTVGKDEFWEKYYPRMRTASEWIISQMKDGLVVCSAEGTNVWGICGWRNIIDNYTLSGAVTEVNAECYFALKCTSEIAKLLGRTSEKEYFESHAEILKSSVNKHLLSDVTGLYLLNRDIAGAPHHDITGDQIFPVFFGIADDGTKKNILKRLTHDDLWTSFGSRTVSPGEKNYDPDFGYQLMGGVWHNLTAWVSYCIRHDEPERLVEGMHNIYRLPEINNLKEYQNVVPGEFPERLHGETFASRGMSLSPWMPPTYLWLAIEGLVGVKPSTGAIEISPAIPVSWNWIAVKDLPWRGSHITALLFEGVLYCSEHVTSRYPLRVGELLDVRSDNQIIAAMSFRLSDGIVLFAVSAEKTQGNVEIRDHGRIFRRQVSLNRNEGILIRVSDTESVMEKV